MHIIFKIEKEKKNGAPKKVHLYKSTLYVFK